MTMALSHKLSPGTLFVLLALFSQLCVWQFFPLAGWAAQIALSRPSGFQAVLGFVVTVVPLGGVTAFGLWAFFNARAWPEVVATWHGIALMCGFISSMLLAMLWLRLVALGMGLVAVVTIAALTAFGAMSEVYAGRMVLRYP